MLNVSEFIKNNSKNKDVLLLISIIFAFSGTSAGMAYKNNYVTQQQMLEKIERIYLEVEHLEELEKKDYLYMRNTLDNLFSLTNKIENEIQNIKIDTLSKINEVKIIIANHEHNDKS